MKDSNDKAAPTAEDVFKERYPTIHDHQYHEVFGWFQDGYLTGKRHAVAQASPVVPSTEAVLTATDDESCRCNEIGCPKCDPSQRSFEAERAADELAGLREHKRYTNEALNLPPETGFIRAATEITAMSKELQEANLKLEAAGILYVQSADREELLSKELQESRAALAAASGLISKSPGILKMKGHIYDAKVIIDAALASSTSKEVEWEHRFIDGPDTSWHPGRLTNLDMSVRLVYEERIVSSKEVEP